MKKLKVLKDLETYYTPTEFISGEDVDGLDTINIKELQETAKEWLEYVDKFDRNGRTYSELEGFDRDIDAHYYHREILLEWIRNFFDLEEE